MQQVAQSTAADTRRSILSSASRNRRSICSGDSRFRILDLRDVVSGFGLGIEPDTLSHPLVAHDNRTRRLILPTSPRVATSIAHLLDVRDSIDHAPLSIPSRGPQERRMVNSIEAANIRPSSDGRCRHAGSHRHVVDGEVFRVGESLRLLCEQVLGL
jgi:hypothetical protein